MIDLDPLYEENLAKSVAIFKGQDSIKFLKFMTPFANELLEDTLVKQLEVDGSFAESLSYVIFGDIEFLHSNIKGKELPIAIYRIRD